MSRSPWFAILTLMTLYTLTRSRRRRRTLALIVAQNATVRVLAPMRTSIEDIESFVQSKTKWIEKTLIKIRHRQQQRRAQGLDPLLVQHYRQLAPQLFSDRLAYWGAQLQVRHTRLIITRTKSRWGSCNRHHHIRLHECLATLPLPLLDYVVVHELCHIVHRNHSKQFWQKVASVIPDYIARRKTLRQYLLE